MKNFIYQQIKVIKEFFAPTDLDTVRERVLYYCRLVMTIAAVFAVVSLIWEYGYGIDELWQAFFVRTLNVFVAIVFIFTNFIRLYWAKEKKAYLRYNLPAFVLIFFLIIQIVLFRFFQQYATFMSILRGLHINTATRGYIVLMQIYILVSLLLNALRIDPILQKLRLYPAQTLALSFLILILIGTFLLHLPKASTKVDGSYFSDKGYKRLLLHYPKATPILQKIAIKTHRGRFCIPADSIESYKDSLGINLASTLERHLESGHISWINALFTSTSAVCVTGLIVLDTAKDFTTLGQMIIMFLIQFGGLGIMTSTAFFAIITGRGVGLKERAFMQNVLSSDVLGNIGRILTYIFTITISAELVGWAVLFRAWLPYFGNDLSTTLYHSMFHSVSAFCNAGFSTFSNNLEDFSYSITTNLMISILIILGGLGFYVIMNLLNYRFRIFGNVRRSKINLQTKLVLIVSGLLILIGTILLFAIEYDNSFAHLSIPAKLMAAYFQSVSTRTAGFNTVPFGDMHNASYFLMMILMFIGASPGGTGGGIKTTTFAILFLTVAATMENNEKIEAFKKTIPLKVIRDAIAVAFLALGAVCFFSFLLFLTEDGKPVIDIFFEVFSAFGTVGLSAGITPSLSFAGKFLITVLMFIGRVGPLTVVLALGQRFRYGTYTYPDGRVMIG